MEVRVRKILAIAGVLVLASSVCYGQGVTPELKTGSKALLFEFSGLSVIAAGDFDGGAGFKYYVSPSMAVRGSVQLSRATRVLAANPVAPQTGIDGSQSATLAGVTAAVERHMGTGRVSPYFGGGLMFSTTSTEGKNVVVGNPPGAQTTTKNDTAGETINGKTYLGGSNAGIFGLMGFEFFLRKEVSLSGEYSIGYTSTSRKDEVATAGAVSVTTKVGSSSLFNISSRGLLTLAVYF
jgi:hypothetical protein